MNAYAKNLAVAVSIFLAGLLLITGATISGDGGMPYIGDPEVPRGNEWFLSYYNEGAGVRVSHDHDVLFHDLGSSVRSAREADVLFLGHSQVLFGLDDAQLRSFASKHRVKLFNMALPSEVSGEFSLRVLEKHGIRPRIIVANLYYAGRLWFLHNAPTAQAAVTMSQDRLSRAKEVMRGNVRWRISSIFGEGLSSWLFGITKPNIVVYRSAVTGAWYNDDSDRLCRFWPRALWHVKGSPPSVSCHAEQLDFSLADGFRNKLASWRSRLLLMNVTPTVINCTESTIEVARHLGVPVIGLDYTDLSFCEGPHGHLDRAGAKLFTERLLRELEGTDEFKRLLVERSGGREQRPPS